MQLSEMLRASMASILANKLRSLLTMLGIIIGVGSVIAMLSTGAGVQRSILASIRSRGTNLLFIRSEARGGRVQGSGGAKPLSNEDVRLLERNPLLERVSPEVQGNEQVLFRNLNMNVRVVGVLPFWAAMHNYVVASGRFFEEFENNGRLRVAVIGETVRQELFAGQDPVGQQIRIRRVPYTVIGQFAPKGGGSFRNEDSVIVIPFATGQRLFGMGDRVANINLQVIEEKQMAQAAEEAAAILRASHRLAPEAADDFRIMNQADFIEMQNSTANTLTVFIASIALVSLIVGGIGIMNIMLVSVTERTREIGLRKAIGARNRDILVQFLVEAVMLSVLGGLIGIGFGSLMAFGISKINIFEGLSWDFQVPLYSIVLSFCFSAVIGVASGYYPARRAAKLDPIEALRYE